MICGLRTRTEEARVALMFLTRLPAGRVARQVPVAATVWAWPLAGACVGGVFALALWLAGLWGLPADVAVVLAMIAALLTTGGLHEDGLADLADGAGGGTDREKRLAIMRDSRLGSYGAMALMLSFLLGFVLWRALPAAEAMVMALAAGAVSRMALPLWALLFASARREGLAHLLREGLTPGPVAAALLLGTGLALCLLPVGSALTGIALCLGLQALICRRAARQLGGLTGDVFGAAQVCGGLAFLLAGV